ncbi:hypothetical protein GCM10010388_07310 [Streptomyces mauvecolor]
MNRGGLDVTQLVCTAANAEVSGAKQPPAVDVRVHEAGAPGIWAVRCNAAGNVIPVPNPSQGVPDRGPPRRAQVRFSRIPDGRLTRVPANGLCRVG